MADASASALDEVRTAEVISALCLATDLGMGLPFEHGLQATLVAMRLAEHMGVDRETATQTYYGCLLFYVGCTADAEVTADLFVPGGLAEHFTPVMFGSRAETFRGIVRALSSTESSAPVRALQVAGRLPRALRGHREHLTALCQVAQMLSARLGIPSTTRDLFESLTERWDGKGEPSGLRGDEIPLALRIIHVSRDAVMQGLIGGEQQAASVVRARAGHAFDPDIAHYLADNVTDVLRLESPSVWDSTLSAEPLPYLTLRESAIDEALAAMADFADLQSPYLVGHSTGVAELAAAAAQHRGFHDVDVTTVRRAALVHDIGRVAIPCDIWQKPGQLTAHEWEQVRLHPYHSERVISRSAFLSTLVPVANSHHERLDGSGYHRGTLAPSLPAASRLLAAADAYHAKIEPRPHRVALSPEQAADRLVHEADRGRLDPESVAAVLEAAGQRVPRMSRPGGLTDRETQVIGLLARGVQTKQIARALGISVKTADRHVQNVYIKIGVSSRAAATVYAMQHGLIAWGELPIARPHSPS